MVTLIGKQTNIVELYEEKSYAELKEILKNHLNPSQDNSGNSTATGPEAVPDVNVPKAASVTSVPSSNTDIEAAFDNLFGN